MIYAMSQNRYNILRRTIKENGKTMSHQDIIDSVNLDLNHGLTHQTSVTVQHNKGYQATVNFKNDRAVTDVIVL